MAVRLAVVIEIVGVVAECVLIYLLLDARHQAGCGERCAMAGMGLVALSSAVMPLALASTVIAIVLGLRARRRYRVHVGARWPVISHGIGAVMPVAVLAALYLTDRPRAELRSTSVAEAPMTERDQYVAGAAFATDNGVETAVGCSAPTPPPPKAFLDGCLSVVRRHGLDSTP